MYVPISKSRRHPLADAYEAAAGGVRPFADQWIRAHGEVLRRPELGELCRAVESGASATGAFKTLLQLPLEPHPEALLGAYESVLASVQRIEKRARRVPTVRVNPLTLEWARRQSGTLIRGIGADARNAIRGVIARQLARGQRAESMVDQIRRHVGLLPAQSLAVERRAALLEQQGELPERVRTLSRQYSDELLFQRALRIARTETTAAQNQGLLDTWRDAQEAGELPDAVVRVWVSAPPSPNPNRPCPICLELDGLEVALDEPYSSALLDAPIMRPPAHPNCMPGDSLVMADAKASSERWYDGELIVIGTAAGHRLACTPNHPVLTPGGWMPASALRVGGHVLGCCLGVRIPALFDQERTPAMIEQLARACAEPGSASSWRVPVAHEDFHGDGRGSSAAMVRTSVRVDGADVQAQEDIPSDADGFAQRLLGQSSRVASYRVTGFDVQSFRGPVFNLETASGAYVAQGLVTHNCRCTMTLRRGSATKE